MKEITQTLISLSKRNTTKMSEKYNNIRFKLNPYTGEKYIKIFKISDLLRFRQYKLSDDGFRSGFYVIRNKYKHNRKCISQINSIKRMMCNYGNDFKEDFRSKE